MLRYIKQRQMTGTEFNLHVHSLFSFLDRTLRASGCSGWRENCHPDGCVSGAGENRVWVILHG